MVRPNFFKAIDIVQNIFRNTKKNSGRSFNYELGDRGQWETCTFYYIRVFILEI